MISCPVSFNHHVECLLHVYSTRNTIHSIVVHRQTVLLLLSSLSSDYLICVHICTWQSICLFIVTLDWVVSERRLVEWVCSVTVYFPLPLLRLLNNALFIISRCQLYHSRRLIAAHVRYSVVAHVLVYIVAIVIALCLLSACGLRYWISIGA